MASATLASQAEVLDRIFTGLKDKNPDTRLQAAIDLQRYVRMLCTRSRVSLADAFPGLQCCTGYVVGRGGEAVGGDREQVVGACAQSNERGEAGRHTSHRCACYALLSCVAC